MSSNLNQHDVEPGEQNAGAKPDSKDPNPKSANSSQGEVTFPSIKLTSDSQSAPSSEGDAFSHLIQRENQEANDQAPENKLDSLRDPALLEELEAESSLFSGQPAAEGDNNGLDDLITSRLDGRQQDELPLSDQPTVEEQPLFPEEAISDEDYAEIFLTGGLHENAPSASSGSSTHHQTDYASNYGYGTLFNDEDESSHQGHAGTSHAKADPDNLRRVALEGYEPEPLPAANSTAVAHEAGGTPLVEKLLIGILVVLIIAVIGGGVYLFGFLPYRSTPAIPAPVSGEKPYPVKLILPGGWSFDLHSGVLGQGGKWSPVGAEWLAGTDLRRLISLPWNRQLDAVVRSFEDGDRFQLLMSNADLLEYSFQSMQEVGVDQTDALNDNSPGLVIILSRPGASVRIIVVGGLIPAAEEKPTP